MNYIFVDFTIQNIESDSNKSLIVYLENVKLKHNIENLKRNDIFPLVKYNVMTGDGTIFDNNNNPIKYFSPRIIQEMDDNCIKEADIGYTHNNNNKKHKIESTGNNLNPESCICCNNNEQYAVCYRCGLFYCEKCTDEKSIYEKCIKCNEETNPAEPCIYCNRYTDNYCDECFMFICNNCKDTKCDNMCDVCEEKYLGDKYWSCYFCGSFTKYCELCKDDLDVCMKHDHRLCKDHKGKIDTCTCSY